MTGTGGMTMRWKRVAGIMVAAAAAGILVFAFRGPHLRPGSILLVEIGGDIPEAPPSLSPLIALIEKPVPTMLDKVMTFRKARQDSRVEAVVLRITRCNFGLAKAQELRDAIRDYTKSGKPIAAYIELEGGGNIEYYIASACDKVYLAESSMLGLSGLSSFSFFLGGVWDKVHVDIQVDKIKEYKSAGDMIGAREMSPELRQMLESILDSEYEQVLSGIAESRGMDKSRVEEIVNSYYIFPDKYVEAGIVDGVKYLDQVLEEYRSSKRLKPEVVKEEEYAKIDPGRLGINQGPKVAVVHGVGNIMTRDPGGFPLRGELMTSERMVKELMELAEDDSIKAVIFRIDSGGGSALASDLIWRATQKVREKKPFVVSMSDVAGSGGYYIACGADRIVAHPGTITGSIGVVTAHLGVGRLLEKMGVNTVTLSRGAYGDIGDWTRPMNPDEREKTRSKMTEVYKMFTGKVSKGRGLAKDRVNEIGRGRVWTGAQAREIGLVDETGGYIKAVEIVKDRLGVPEDKDVELVYKRPPVTIWQVLLGRGTEVYMKMLLTKEERDMVAFLRDMKIYRQGEPLLLMPMMRVY
jgi:protease-4